MSMKSQAGPEQLGLDAAMTPHRLRPGQARLRTSAISRLQCAHAQNRPMRTTQQVQGNPAEIPAVRPGFWPENQVKARGKDFFEYLCHLMTQEVCQEKQACPRAAENSTGVTSGSTSASRTSPPLGLEGCSDRASPELDAHVLVVSHGAFMRNWVGYFVSDLACTLPATLTKTELSSVSPNTGISHFIVKLDSKDHTAPSISCLYLNRDDHLRGMAAEKL